MKKVCVIIALAGFFGFGACADGFVGGSSGQTGAVTSANEAAEVASRETWFAPPQSTLSNDQTRPDLAPVPSAAARTVEQFDTTTVEERAAATAAPIERDARKFGSTIASLGSPTDPGLWFKTPLVTSAMPGRIELDGRSVNVELRPSGGEAGAGSQISLAAMRLLGVPLTSLPEVSVYGS